ncbi:MAG: SatD family protein [Acidobacteriota bacterium]
MSSTVPTEPFVAVIGDLVGSRQIEDRAAAQERLVEVLELLNTKYREHVASRFVVTLGDEFQGLLAIDAPVDGLWWTYQREMPYPTHFGFGFGTLATPLKAEALGMDGPCWYAARSALELAEVEARRFTVEIVGEPATSRRLNKIISLIDRTMERWTPKQLDTVLLLQELESQLEVAESRGVKAQTVSGSLEASLGQDVLDSISGVLELAQSISRTSPSQEQRVEIG